MNERNEYIKNSQTITIPLLISLFWGSLWGIVEATLGYGAHVFIRIPGAVGFILFPIGFYFMMRAFKSSGKMWAIISTAAVASTIKLLDLFLPGLNPIYTINPAVSILMEALVVWVGVKLLNRSKRELQQLGFGGILAVCGGWRLGFLCYSLVLYLFSVSPVLVQGGLGVVSRFLLLESLVNAVIIIAFLKIKKPSMPFFFANIRIKPAWAVSAFSGAIFIKLLLASL
jgi:hypothetical protein